jgi:hypothetical protein
VALNSWFSHEINLSLPINIKVIWIRICNTSYRGLMTLHKYKMQLHTGAEHFGNVIFRYSELASQYHLDASIDVNRMWRAHDKTIVSQSGTVPEMYSFTRKTVIIQSNTKTNNGTKCACPSTELLLTYLKNILKTFRYCWS